MLCNERLLQRRRLQNESRMLQKSRFLSDEIKRKCGCDERLSNAQRKIGVSPLNTWNTKINHKMVFFRALSPLSGQAKHIKDHKEIEHQREYFAKLSNSMYALVFNFKANETEAYLQYCPMKKASWLSNSKDIKNPYYGKKMLDCGSVKATLKNNK